MKTARAASARRPARPKTKTREPWRVAKFGPVSIPIYRSHEAGAWRHIVCWYEGGTRRRSKITTEAAALETADRLARRLAAHGTSDTRVISAADEKALAILRKLGEPLAVATQVAEAAEKLNGRTWSEAADFVARFMPSRGDATVTVSAALAAYTAEVIPRMAPSHQRGLRSKLGIFDRALGTTPLLHLTPSIIDTWFQRLPGANRYQNNILKSVTAFLNWTRDTKGWLPADLPVAAKKVRTRRLGKDEPAVWSPAQARALLDALPPPLQLYVAIGCFAGLRPTEIARYRSHGLSWQDIDFAAGQIRVRKEVATKLSEARYLPLEPCLAAWLLPHRRDKGPICHASSAGMITDWKRREEFPIPWPADVMRHSYISYQLARTGNRAQVAEWAGNSPAIIRKAYRRPVPPDEGKAWFNIFPAAFEEGKVVAMTK